MFKRLLLCATLIALAAPAVLAQDQTRRVYVAYYQVSYGDLEEWIGSYNQASVPILESMVEAGSILGFGARMHSTGGHHNWRFVMQGDDDTDFSAAWSEYLGRLTEAQGADAERMTRMIQAHEDEIWRIDQLVLPEGGTAGEAKYFYDAQFQVNFADLEAWSEMWSETFGPVMEAAMEEGLVDGWVTESHDTGGRYNWKVIMIFNDWDNIDDVTERVFTAAPLSHPIWDLFTAHRDEVWESLPPMDN